MAASAELLRKLKQSIETGDAELWSSLHSDDFEQTQLSTSSNPRTRTREDVAAIVGRAVKRGAKCTVENMVDGGDRIAYTATRVFPNGRTVISSSNAEVKDGLIVRELVVEAEESGESQVAGSLPKLVEAAASWTTVYPRELVYNHPPLRIHGGRDFFRELERREAPAAGVAVLVNGQLWADDRQSAVVTPAGKLIWDPSYRGQPIEQHWFSEVDLPPVQHRGGAFAVLTMPPGWNDSYSHWMLQLLPRLHVVQRSGVAVDRLALHPVRTRFQRETLATLGVVGETIFELTHPIRLAARLAVAPPAPSIVPRWVCGFLRETFLGDDDSRSDDRLFISRATARWRRVRNEDEVMSLLAARGFRSITPESMSVTEQAKSFARAACVIGPHGAGLTNLVFCKAGATVVELFNRRYVPPHYWLLSNRRELNYYCVIADPGGEKAREKEQPQTWPGPGAARYDDLAIDVDALESILTTAGI
jgi:hypothetical protein